MAQGPSVIVLFLVKEIVESIKKGKSLSGKSMISWRYWSSLARIRKGDTIAEDVST